jgi:hypothetical protein
MNDLPHGLVEKTSTPAAPTRARQSILQRAFTG